MRGKIDPSEPPTQFFTTLDFPTDSGVKLPLLKLAYKTYGVLQAGHHRVVIVSTCFGEVVSSSSRRGNEYTIKILNVIPNNLDRRIESFDWDRQSSRSG